MNLSADDTIVITQKCHYCKGQGVVSNPMWEEFNQEVKAGRATVEKMEQWFLQRGTATTKMHMGQEYCALPPEETPCGECEGERSVQKTVTLMELAALLKSI